MGGYVSVSQLAQSIYLSEKQLSHQMYQGIFYDSKFSDISRTSTKPLVKTVNGVAGTHLAYHRPQLQIENGRMKNKGMESHLNNSFGLLIKTPAPFYSL